jgi:hypothetical protein
MTVDEFRAIALSLPDTVESSHMNHPDFRVHGKIFATLGYPSREWGVVAVTPEEQARFSQAEPDVFVPVKGGWGRAGSTQVYLHLARKRSVRAALQAAWRNRAPKDQPPPDRKPATKGQTRRRGAASAARHKKL